MSYYGTMQVVDESGWAKTFPLEKALTLIGSAAFNDVVLSQERGSGVAAAHLQLIRMQTGTRGFRLVNLFGEPLAISLARARGDAIIPPNGSRDLEDGDAVRVGNFTITFYLRAINGVSLEKRSENIGIRLEMPGVTLRPEARLAGLLTVMNFGEEKRSQFEIELEGFPSDCYQIDPAPLLYPGGEEKLQIRFYHRGIRPAAGECPIRLRASAVGAYPTEEVILPIVLDVEPVYRYVVDVLEEQNSLKEILEPVLPLPEPNIASHDPVLSTAMELSTPAERSPQPVIAPPESMATPSTPQVIIAAATKSTQPSANETANTFTKSPASDLPLKSNPPQPNNPEIFQSTSQPAPEHSNEVETELDWWADEKEELPVVAHSDPLAELKRGIKPRLSVENTNIQVLKAASENLQEKNDESQSDNAERVEKKP